MKYQKTVKLIDTYISENVEKMYSYKNGFDYDVYIDSDSFGYNLKLELNGFQGYEYLIVSIEDSWEGIFFKYKRKIGTEKWVYYTGYRTHLLPNVNKALEEAINEARIINKYRHNWDSYKMTKGGPGC